MIKPRRSFVTFVSSVISSIFGRFNILLLPSRQSWLKSGIPLGVFQWWLWTRLELSCCRSGIHTQSLTPLASVARYKAPLVVRPGVEAQKRISMSEMKISRRWHSNNISIGACASTSSRRLLAAPPHTISSRFDGEIGQIEVVFERIEVAFGSFTVRRRAAFGLEMAYGKRFVDNLVRSRIADICRRRKTECIKVCRISGFRR